AERPVAAALRDVCASEGGWFAIAADGTPTFRDRHARPRRTTPNVVLSAGLVELHARRGEQAVANSVEVTVHPRMVGEPGEVLWRAGHAVRLAPGEVRTLVCRYQDPTEHVMEVGALSVELPRRGVDFTATDRVDGTGEDLTHTVMVALESGARGAALTLWSDGADERAVYVHGLQLRGTPLRRYTPVTVRVEDDASIVTRGRHPLRVELPLQDDARTGEDVARALLANRREPHPWPVIGLEATARAALLAAALGADVGTRSHLDAPPLGPGGAGEGPAASSPSATTASGAGRRIASHGAPPPPICTRTGCSVPGWGSTRGWGIEAYGYGRHKHRVQRIGGPRREPYAGGKGYCCTQQLPLKGEHNP